VCIGRQIARIQRLVFPVKRGQSQAAHDGAPPARSSPMTNGVVP
jgi:hypothetical protein